MVNKKSLPFIILAVFTLFMMIFPAQQVLGLKKALTDVPTWFLLTFLASLFMSSKQKDTFERKLNTSKAPLLVFSFFALSFFVFQYLRFINFEFSAGDYSHFDYTTWNTVKGRALALTIGEDDLYYVNLLGNHFAPILFLFSIPHLLVESHLWLPLLQSVIMAGFGYIIYSVFKKKTGSYHALFFAMALLLSKFPMKILKFEFHHEIVYLPLVFLTMYFTDKALRSDKETKKSVLYAIIFFVLSLLTKEDSPIIFIGPCLYFIVREKCFKRKALFSALFIFNIIYLFAAVKIIMPLFHKPDYDPSSSTYMGLWTDYGRSMSEIIINAIKNPHMVIKDVFTNKTLYYMLIPFLFTPVFGITSLIFLPVFTLHSMSSSSLMKHMVIYYSSPILPLVVFGVYLNWERIQNLTLKGKKFAAPLSIILLVSFNIGGFSLPKLASDYKKANESLEKLNEITKNFSEKTFVAGSLLGRLDYNVNFKRYSHPDYLDDLSAKYYLFSRHGNTFPINPNQIDKAIKRLSKEMKIKFSENGIFLFER